MFDAVFLGAAMQIPSLLQIEAECCLGALAKRIGPISDDTLGYALERQSPESLFALSCSIARRLKRNGVLRSEWSRGLVVGAVDGIEICAVIVLNLSSDLVVYLALDLALVLNPLGDWPR